MNANPCLRTFLASYSFTSSSPLFYLVPSQSAHFFSFTTKLPPGLFGLDGYLPSCKLILHPLLHFTPFFLINLTTWFLRGSSVLLVIYQVVSSFSILSFTSLFSFPFSSSFLVSLLFILIFLSFFHINITTWFLRGSSVLLVIYQVASSFSILAFTSLFSFPLYLFQSASYFSLPSLFL